MNILGIDPGTTQSGWCLLCDGEHIESGVIGNAALLYNLPSFASDKQADMLAIEIFEARGMPIGDESIETIIWTGRMMQAWIGNVRRVKRSDVKRHLCGTLRAKDANVRQALIDKFGGNGKAIGRKASPGPLYGVKSHAWAALAVCVTAAETCE